MRSGLAGLGAWVVLGLVGCATTPVVTPGPTEGREVEKGEERMLTAGIWDVKEGEVLEAEELFRRMETMTVVLVGESHGTEFHHQVQGRMYEEMSARRPGEVLLGMEMVERRFQEALDAYVEGERTEEEWLEEVEWSERWGVAPELYASMWRLAQEKGQRVVGLNAQRELVRRVREVGVEGLSEEERERLPEVFLGNQEHRAFLSEIFASHGMGDNQEMIDLFYQAQVVWDETMAETAVQAIEEAGQGGQMMVIAGRFHVERGYGIPSRMIRRGIEAEKVVIVIPVNEEMESYRDLEFLRRESIADYVWVE